MMKKYLFFFFIGLFFAGCSQKLVVKSLKPAAIDDMDVKTLALGKFKKDTISLKANINASLDRVTFHNKKYFTIVNRDATDKILEEQKLQDSGLVINKGEEEYGLSDISSIIMGEVTSTNYTTRSYYESRTNYNRCLKYNSKKKCIQYTKYNVRCHNYYYGVSANITITKVSNSEILYTNSFTKQRQFSKCRDESRTIPSKQSIFENLSASIAQDFVKAISPNYEYIHLELLEDEDIDFTSKQEDMLENALKLIELHDIKSANSLLQKLTNQTQNKSATVLYNLGVTYEYLEDLNNANRYYQLAKEITLEGELDENIVKAANRITKAIANQKKALRQISQ
jgi:tetratricopeptide (TPR) repeat protein